MHRAGLSDLLDQLAAESRGRPSPDGLRQRKAQRPAKPPKVRRPKGAPPEASFAPDSGLTCIPFKPNLPKKGVTTEDLLEAMRAHVRAIAERGNPVIVGPFTTEVGFELLYWLPLVRWALREAPDLESRLIGLSRGGPHSWYAPSVASYVDAFALAPVEEFVSRRSSQKQREVTSFEAELCGRAVKRAGLAEVDVLHPSLMFNAYYHPTVKVDKTIWAGSVEAGNPAPTGFGAVYERISDPDPDGILDGLPERYVAVRFYFRESFPDTPAIREFVARVLDRLTAHIDVVLLNTGIAVDEHVDWRGVDAARVHTLDHLMTPATNLHVQTVAISRATAFVGTYGGLSYLPPFTGVPSIAFSSDPDQTMPWHLELAEAVFRSPGWASLAPMHTGDLALFDRFNAELAATGR